MSNKNLDFEIPFEWYRGGETQKVAVFTDFSLDEVDLCDSEIKIAMLMESPEVFPAAYNQIVALEDKFDMVLTFSKKLLQLRGKFHPYRLGGTWIKEKDWAIYHKTKDVSMIASHKKTTIGQILRHKILELINTNFKDIPPYINVDVYGKIENEIEYKFEGLRDYRFSFALENCSHDYYFTEKIIDCFLTGTIPIYYGCTDFSDGNIESNFLRQIDLNPEGIIQFTNIEKLHEILNPSLERLYDTKKSAILHNFFVAQKYVTPEFQIWDYLKKYYE